MKPDACHLSEIAEIFSGFAFKSGDLTRSGIPVIKIANIQGKRVLGTCADHLPPELFTSRLERYVLQKRDCLVAMTGAGSVGKVGKMWDLHDRFLVNQRVGIVRPNESRCDPNYLFHVLSLERYEKILYGLGLGAGQPNVSAKEIGSLRIPLPDVTNQRKIASVLSAYDNLIENNLRRIKILEEMAQTLYREWFVKFRFPGHEKTRFVDSPMGEVPEGWEVKKLGELTHVITKGTTPTTFGRPFTEEGIHFVKVESVDNQGAIREEKLAYIDEETHALLKRSQLAKNDILYSIAGAIGRVALVPERILPANTNQALAIIRPSDPLLVPYLYLSIRSTEFVNFSLGRVVQTAQANVSLSVLSAAPIVVPAVGLLQSLEGVVGPMLGQIDCLLTKSSVLRRTRDLLLPRLISGELDVSDLDIPTDQEPA